MAPPRTAIQPSRDARLRDCESRSTPSSSSGTQLIPATSPKWDTSADMAPANANEIAPRAPAGGQAQGAQEEEHPEPGHRPGDDQVQRPRGGGGQEGEQERQRVGGARVPAAEQGGAAPQVRVKQRQLAGPQLAAGQHAQREVLGQVIAGQHRVPQQRRDTEHEDRQHEQQDDGQDIAGPPPGRLRAEVVKDPFGRIGRPR